MVLFFLYIPNGNTYYPNVLASSEKEIRAKSLKHNCVTSWIGRFHSIQDFVELMDCVVESLEIIILWNDIETLFQANNLKNTILQFEFLVYIFGSI